MRRGLVGDDVDRRVLLEQGREHLGRVAEHPDGQRLPGVARLDRELDGVLERVGLHVEVAVLDAALDPAVVDVDADRDAVVHRHGERLGATHAAEPGGQRDRAGERAAEALVGHGRERLEGALEDALGADVDPRAGGHLAVHRQAEVLEPAELLPVGPVADQVGVGDQHARRPLVGAHDADRLAALHEHGLVVGEGGQGADQGVVRLPVARGLAGPAVHHQLGGVLGVLRVEVVHQHPQRRLGLPRAGGQLGAVGGVDGQAGVVGSLQVSDHFFDGMRGRRPSGPARRRSRSRARGGGRGRGPGSPTSAAGRPPRRWPATAPADGAGRAPARR